MNEPTTSIIVALAKKNRVIGKNNELLWHIPTDLKRFRELTTGHVVIMGRKTYESIGKPLARRINIVITRNPQYQAPGCVVVSSLEQALQKGRKIETKEIFVIGGGDIYKQALQYCQKLYLTLVEGDFDGDTYFPEYKDAFTHIVSSEHGKTDKYRYTFLTLIRE